MGTRRRARELALQLLYQHELTGASIEEAQQEDASRILAILERIRAPILYILGNGDMIEFKPQSSQIQNLLRKDKIAI